MSVAGEEQLHREAKGFRPNSMPLFVMLGGNLLLAAICLGIPYYRGQVQAKAALGAFNEFAVCLLDAEPANRMGLGMPVGERSRFAGRMLGADAEWPHSCQKHLHAIRPEEAIFLWPSVKQAGADVRTIVGLVEEELEAVAERRKAGPTARIPERPLLALAKLRAGLTLLARAAGTTDALDADAVRFVSDAGVVEPALLPLMAASDAALDLWMGQDGIEAVGVDGRGISWLKVEGGEIERRRFRRTSLIRGAVRVGDEPYVVWAMPPDRCDEREDGCAKRAAGVARFDKAGTALPDPIWLAGHPLGRFDRSLRVQPGQPTMVELLARADGAGHAELRRFVLIRPEGDKPRPLSPVAQFPLPTQAAPLDALLLDGGSVLHAEADADGIAVRLWHPEQEGGDAEPLARLAGQAPWLATCGNGAERWLVYASDRQLGAARVVAGEAPAPAAPVDVAPRRPLDAEDPSRDRLRVLCERGGASILFLDQKARLSRVRCDAEACHPPGALASDVDSFDAASAGELLHVAYTGKTSAEIVVLRVEPGGAIAGEATTPAVCWDPLAGMCGHPSLLASPSRVILAARQRADLLAIESNDGGESWGTMSGLKVGSAISTDAASPMDQHRIRKGID